MKNNSLKVLGIIVIILLVIVGIVLGFSGNKNGGKKAPQSLVIGHVTFPGYAPLHIAQQKGFYGDTKVSFVTIESLDEMRAAMTAGSIDGYLMTYDMFQSVKGSMPSAVAVLATDDSRGADGIIASTNITSAKDLKNKKVATEPGFPAYFLLQSYLHDAGMTLSDIDFKDIPSKDSPAAYRSGKLDAMGNYEPYLSETLASSKNTHLLVSTKDTDGLIMEYLWVSPETLVEKQEALANVARGYFAALDYINSNNDEALTIGGTAFGISLEEMKGYQSGILWPNLEDNKKLFGSGPKSARARFKYVGDVLRENNETDLTLDANKYFSNKIIDQIK